MTTNNTWVEGGLGDTSGWTNPAISEQLADMAVSNFGDINRQKLFYLLKNSTTATFVGDSVTEGVASNNWKGWFEPLRSKFPNTTFVNKGVGGNGTVDVINRLADIKSSNADLYVVAIGTNDVRYQNSAKGATSASAFATNIQTIVTSLKATGADVVVIEPFPAHNADYLSVLGFSDRDRTMKAYSAESKKYCGANNIPYIEIIDIIKNAVDFANKSSFYLDSIHPNSTIGLQFYSDVILYGKRTSENYGVAKTRSTAKYLYKLEIESATVGNSIDLQLLTANSTVTGLYTTCMKNGNSDVTQIFNTSNTTYHFQNTDNDFPVIIVFERSAQLTRLSQQFFTSGIGKYKLYESIEPDAYLNFTHPSWKIIAGHDWSGTSARPMLYNASQNFSLSYSNGWGTTPQYNSYKTSGDEVFLNARWKKTAAWTAGELIATIPDGLRPPYELIVPAQMQPSAGTTSEMGFIIIGSDGTIKCPNRTTNPNANDSVQTVFSYNLIGN